MTTSTRGELDALLDYVETELDFATSHYNDAYLGRRVNARMRRTGAESVDAYLDQLSSDDEEATALLDAFSINVTSFFRNPPIWDRLREVLRDLSADRRRVRVWSAACSDGREPYSLAILARSDPAVDAGRVRITATDVNASVLRQAREGRYRSTRTTDIEEELSYLDDALEYVDVAGDQFAVGRRVKRLVDFRRHDLIRDEPLGPFDLVLCRNLFIYIDPAYKEPILETIDASLASGAYLVVGMAETLPPAYRESFEPIGDRSRVHRRVE